MSNAIEVHGLVKTYPDFTLDHIDLTLERGTIMGLIGENGAGKSTTIKAILDLIQIDQGEILIFGRPMNEKSQEAKEHIGVVMDECCFPENLSATDVDLVLRNIYRTWSSQRFKEMLSQFSLPAKKRIKEYSRGMKMKLSIAVALSHDSHLLILDEATSGLDPVVRDEMLDIFLEFIQDESHSILISSHIVSDLEKICDYITFIHGGRVQLSDSKDEILNRYGILKCSLKEFEHIPQDKILGYRKNAFEAEVLIEKHSYRGNGLMDFASLEDVMLLMGKRGA